MGLTGTWTVLSADSTTSIFTVSNGATTLTCQVPDVIIGDQTAILSCLRQLIITATASPPTKPTPINVAPLVGTTL